MGLPRSGGRVAASNCVGYSAADAPGSRRPLTNNRAAPPTWAPRFQTKCRGRPGARKRDHRSTREPFWRQQGQQRGCGAAAQGRRVESATSSLQPLGPGRQILHRPPSSVRRAHRGLRAVKRPRTPGHPRHQNSLGSPFGSGACLMPTSARVPATPPVVPVTSGAGSTGFSAPS